MSKGRYLAELRSSGAAGIHVPSGTRDSEKRSAIDSQISDMEENEMSANVISFPSPIGIQDGPSDDEVLALTAEEQRAQNEFAKICQAYGVTPDGSDLDDYVPETDVPDRNDYRVVGTGDEDEYEWTEN